MNASRAAASTITEAPPAGTARLFPHLTDGVPLASESRAFLIARLLEEGEGTDLAWLTSVVPLRLKCFLRTVLARFDKLRTQNSSGMESFRSMSSLSRASCRIAAARSAAYCFSFSPLMIWPMREQDIPK